MTVMAWSRSFPRPIYSAILIREISRPPIKAALDPLQPSALSVNGGRAQRRTFLEKSAKNGRDANRDQRSSIRIESKPYWEQ